MAENVAKERRGQPVLDRPRLVLPDVGAAADHDDHQALLAQQRHGRSPSRLFLVTDSGQCGSRFRSCRHVAGLSSAAILWFTLIPAARR